MCGKFSGGFTVCRDLAADNPAVLKERYHQITYAQNQRSSWSVRNQEQPAIIQRFDPTTGRIRPLRQCDRYNGCSPRPEPLVADLCRHRSRSENRPVRFAFVIQIHFGPQRRQETLLTDHPCGMGHCDGLCVPSPRHHTPADSMGLAERELAEDALHQAQSRFTQEYRGQSRTIAVLKRYPHSGLFKEICATTRRHSIPGYENVFHIFCTTLGVLCPVLHTSSPSLACSA